MDVHGILADDEFRVQQKQNKKRYRVNEFEN